MATLVLSTVGTVLGGPVGSAIGALIGQSIDQQILAPASRGPRLGDLSVQTSSYGTQIPRIYGTMRVAGSVVWSTDLTESAQTTGAKGQPDVVYSYSVSFAVALSSRRAVRVRRIWADGKLIRGDDEQFKVSTTFRFYDGSEDQIIDPLIGSIEGIGSTPAYRGQALAVFENLELAEFGNRIPFLTFEIVADETPPAIGAILEDASRGAIVSEADQIVDGYAAYGRSIRAAVEPVVSCYGVELFDDGLALHAPMGASLSKMMSSATAQTFRGRRASSGSSFRRVPCRRCSGFPITIRRATIGPARRERAPANRAAMRRSRNSPLSSTQQQQRRWRNKCSRGPGPNATSSR